MKTSFNIAWIDDNLSDPEMDLTSQLERKLQRKNGFSLNVDDIYDEVHNGDINTILSNISNTIDLSNSIDLVVVDCQLGGDETGEKIAKRFRDTLPSVDILFYSGKESAEKLRLMLAKENVDNVNCVGRINLVEGSYKVIESIIDRSHKISTLRGLILNSVCEIDNMIIDILCKHYSSSSKEVRNSFVNKVATFISKGGSNATRSSRKSALALLPIEDLLQNSKITSGSLFIYLKDIKNNLHLLPKQLSILDSYESAILDLRNSAAHSKEGVCSVTGESMLENKLLSKKYTRSNIDNICKTIVSHENNIKSILSDFV